MEIASIIGKHFQIEKVIYTDGGGVEVYQVFHNETKMKFAIKFESKWVRKPTLLFEASIIQHFLSKSSVIDKGIPNVYQAETAESGDKFLVMDLLGPSLQDLFEQCGKKFSLKTVLMLVDQMLTRIEYVHERNILHRNIKPGNFLIGRESNSKKVFIVDFGHSKQFIKKDGCHIPYREDKSPLGNLNFISINVHFGIEGSRRDDLEALGYVLVYFLKGSLPWENLPNSGWIDCWEKILEKKLSMSLENLFYECPEEFFEYMKYSRYLRFDEKPDYNYLRQLFKNLFEKKGFKYDYQYDWEIEKDESEQEQNEQNLQETIIKPSDAIIGNKIDEKKQKDEIIQEEEKTSDYKV